jgi:hypothetical protein
MGTDLPITSPLSGAIRRWVRKVFNIRSRLLDSTVRAGDLRAGRQSRLREAGVSTSSDDDIGDATHDVDAVRRPRGGSPARAHSSKRTIGRGALPGWAWRRATTENPARSNIDSVPR